MKTISDADWEIIKSAAQVAIDGTLSRSKHKEWSDAMARVETHKPMDVPGAWHTGIVSLLSDHDTHDQDIADGISDALGNFVYAKVPRDMLGNGINAALAPGEKYYRPSGLLVELVRDSAAKFKAGK